MALISFSHLKIAYSTFSALTFRTTSSLKQLARLLNSESAVS